MRKMTGPEKLGSVVVAWSLWSQFGIRVRHWYDQYQLRRDCPHPDHRVFAIYEGDEEEAQLLEFYCDECGGYFEPEEVTDEEDETAQSEKRQQKPGDMG